MVQPSYRVVNHEWLKADLALKYVTDDDYPLPDQCRICERAHSGLIAAKAEKLIWGDKEKDNALLPKTFWWAEGREALEQDWSTGAFSTWIDGKVEAKAYGVSFDFVPLTQMVPVELQANAMRRISVIGDDEWISAHELYNLMAGTSGPFAARLREACKTGQIAGRALRAVGLYRGPNDFDHRQVWAAIQYDISLAFWREYMRPAVSKFDWQTDCFSGEGGPKQGFEKIELQGVHFHRSGLANLGIEDRREVDEAAPPAKRGRKPSYDWPAATVAMFGLIYRGELRPESQADIERALIDHLAKGDATPSESTVRPYAKKVWEESQKA